MRMVVDSNYLRCDKLRSYLDASKTNYAVLTDYAAMEAYKGENLAGIYRSWEIISAFPKQIIVLKRTQAICGLNGREASSQTALIDKNQTQKLPEYFRNLIAAQTGDLRLQQQLLDHGREATAHIDRMILEMPTLVTGINLLEKTYSAAELRILRCFEKPTPEMHEKMIKTILALAGEFFRRHPSIVTFPKLPDARDMFVFRYAICSYVSILQRIETGGVGRTKLEKLRNDVIDVNFASFGTLFDGLLTSDRKAAATYDHAKFLLREVFAMPPWGLRWLFRRSL